MSNSTMRQLGLKIVLLCHFAWVTTLAASANGSETVNLADCIGFAQDPLENGAEFHLVNQCKQRVTCVVTWTVSCGDAPPFRHIHASANVSVGPAAERDVIANATACATDSWEISHVTWSCRQ